MVIPLLSPKMQVQVCRTISGVLYCCMLVFINFTTKLVERFIDAPRLLEQLCIRVPGNTRSQDYFYPPTCKTNFAKNSLIIRIMSITNNSKFLVPRLH